MPEDDEGTDETEGTSARAEQALRSLGNTLGGWAKRVGTLVSEVSGQGTAVPEAIRGTLEEARGFRRAGELGRAQAVLDRALEERPDEPHLHAALSLVRVYEFLFQEGRPHDAPSQDSKDGRPLAQLVAATHRLSRDDTEGALDALRRAMRDSTGLGPNDDAEARMLAHLLAFLAHQRRGRGERCLRELNKARPRIPVDAGLSLRRWVARRGVETLLAEGGSAGDAERWLDQDLAPFAGEDPVTHQLLLLLRARIAAVRNDRESAHAALEMAGSPAPDDAFASECWTRVGMIVGLPGGDDVRAVARRSLEQDPENPRRRRLWALAHLQTIPIDHTAAPPPESQARAWLTALAEAARMSPAGLLDRHLAELAHAALRLDIVVDEVSALIERRLQEDPGTCPEELRLVRARRRVARGDAAMQHDFDDGPPVRFRAGVELGGPHGPDESSPLRDEVLRQAVRAGGRALAAAEYCTVRGHGDQAQDLLVEALTIAPGLFRARSLMATIASHGPTPRLEDILRVATDTLAALPPRVLGMPLTDLQDCLARVIAARERLARPLTIAIMGEFSSGKSTFVNALLGQAIAPMGVLPTTSTINVFRRGAGGGARVHYRDGSISTLSPSQVEPFLTGLDDQQASRIRHVEIERTDARFGDASVVDTPGLNGLDPFHEQVAREFLDEADAVVWVFSATRGGAASEVGMLNSLRAGGRQVLGILNKVDILEPGEREQLSTYLRHQLGDVLVDVIGLDGQAALRHRIDHGAAGDDPFSPVEHALERHFLGRAREVKRSVTLRRLSDALTDARTHLQGTVAALEERARASESMDRSAALDGREALTHFADGLHDGILAIDDLLTREAMGLGLLRGSRKIRRSSADDQDLIYLDGVVRTGVFRALGRALADVAQRPGGEHLAPVLEQQFLEWARGYVDGQIEAGFMARVVRRQTDMADQGEAVVRSGLRAALQPMAQAIRRRVLDLAPAIEHLRAREALEATASPRAEALRLRTIVLARLDDLIGATEGLMA